MVPEKKIILYVDDDPDDQLLMLETIREITADVRVACAMNGVEALRYLERTKKAPEDRPSLVLMDINMPLMNGKESLLLINGDPVLRSLPVVMFTTSAAEEDRTFCLRNGAVDFITKPFTLEALKAVIQRCLLLLGT